MRLKAGAEESFPRSSADFDQGFRRFLRSPSPRDGERTGEAGLRWPVEAGEWSNAVTVRASERSSTDLSRAIRYYKRTRGKRRTSFKRTCWQWECCLLQVLDAAGREWDGDLWGERSLVFSLNSS